MALPHREVPAHARSLSLEAIIDSLPAAVLVVEESERIVLANRRAAQLLAQPVERLVGTLVGEVLAPLKTLLSLRPGESGHNGRELRIRVGDEQETMIGLNIERVTEPAGASLGTMPGAMPGTTITRHWAITFQDIRRIAELQRERNHLLSMAAISEAMPTLLHELKNPVAAAAAAIEVMLESSFDGDRRTQRALHAILSQLRRMRLTLEGFSLGNRELPSVRCHAIDQTCRETMLILEAYARSKEVDVETVVPTLPLLPIDDAVMRALVFNLFVNALDACREGHSIRVELRLEGGVLELVVADTGEGMPEEVRRRCTELFYTTKSKGTGIGLALCQQVVVGARGTLDIDSVLGRGTTVKVRVPVPQGRPPGANRTPVEE